MGAATERKHLLQAFQNWNSGQEREIKCPTERFTKGSGSVSQNVSQIVPQMFPRSVAKAHLRTHDHIAFAENKLLNKKLFQRNRFSGRENNKSVLSRERFSGGNPLSVPLWGTLEMNLDGLFWVGDVEPAAVTFPTFGENLDEHSSQRGIGNMGDAVTIGLHV